MSILVITFWQTIFRFMAKVYYFNLPKCIKTLIGYSIENIITVTCGYLNQKTVFYYNKMVLENKFNNSQLRTHFV